MNRILINICLLFFVLLSYGQKIEKKTIYLEFKFEKNCSRKQKFFYEEENGIVFNLFCEKNGSFLYKTKLDTLPENIVTDHKISPLEKSDTLAINKFTNYKIASLEEVEILEKEWRIKNKKAMIKKFGKIYPWYNKNGIFKTYLIEIINDKQFVIYPVEWRGEDVDCNLDEVPPPPRNNR